MPLPVLRSAVLAAARSAGIERLITHAPVSRDVVRRFVGGPDTAAAVATARELVAAGLTVSLDHLGEDTADPDQARVVAAAYTGLLALCWHLALPLVPLALWMLLVTGRQLVARLPLVPNKDIVFANLAVFLVGNDAAVTRLVALTVALTLLCHVIVFALTWLPLRKGAAA